MTTVADKPSVMVAYGVYVVFFVLIAEFAMAFYLVSLFIWGWHYLMLKMTSKWFANGLVLIVVLGILTSNVTKLSHFTGHASKGLQAMINPVFCAAIYEKKNSDTSYVLTKELAALKCLEKDKGESVGDPEE